MFRAGRSDYARRGFCYWPPASNRSCFRFFLGAVLLSATGVHAQLLKEYKVNRKYKKNYCYQMVPLECLAFEEYRNNDTEYKA